MTYDVIFSLGAAAELVKIMEVLSPISALRATEDIRHALEFDPRKSGTELSEGLLYIDREPLRAFYEIQEDTMVVEVTDFRIL